MATPPARRRWAVIIAVPALALALLTSVIAAPEAAWADISGLGAESSTGPNPATVAAPAGVQEGDFLIAMVTSNSGIGVIEAPADWTVVSASNDTAAFWHIVGSSEPASYQFGNSNPGSSAAVVVAAYRGVDPTAPINAETAHTGVGSDLVAGNVTTTVPGATLMVMHRTLQGTPAPSAPSGMSLVATQTGLPGANIFVFEEVLGAAGPTGPRITPSVPVGNPWESITVALAPLRAATVTPTTLTESNLDGNTIAVQLAGTTFVPAPAVGDFALVDAPPGASIAGVQRDSNSQITLTLAFDGTDFDTDAAPTVTIAGAALVSTAAITSAPFTITAEVEAAPAAQLPATGPAPWLPALAITALVLLSLGLLGLLVSRRASRR